MKKNFVMRGLALAIMALAADAVAGTVESTGSRAAAEAVAIRIDRFVIAGAQALPEGELQAALADWRDRPLATQDLAGLKLALERVYGEHHLIASISLPPQDLSDGTLRIVVTEARLGRLQVLAEPEMGAISGERAAAFVAAQQAADAPLRTDAVDRALSLLNDWPGLSASAALQPGAQAGQTDLLLSLAPRRDWTASARVDNEGARATGMARVLLDASTALPGQQGITLGASTVLSKGSQQLHLNLDAPLGDRGLHLGGYASVMRYKLSTPDFEPLDIQGPASAFGALASWPLTRGAEARSDVTAQLERRHYDNKIADVTSSRYRIDALTLRATHQGSSAPGSGAQQLGELGLVLGDANLDGSPNQAADALTARTAGHYAVLRGNLVRQQPLDAEQHLLLKACAQWANRNLDVSERLSIAGPEGVRAYPVGEASGSQGLMMSVDWQHSLSALGLPGWHAAGFIDWGRVEQLKQGHFDGGPRPNNLTLAGAGLWLEGRWASSVVSRLTWALPQRPHPHPTDDGRNQDGSRYGARWWASTQWTV